jgi:alpha-galactosidase
VTYNPDDHSFTLGGIRLAELAPLVDGEIPNHRLEASSDDHILWRLDDGCLVDLTISGEKLELTLSGFTGERRLSALGLRIGQASNVRQYLRNGYMSWDGSYFVEPANALDVVKSDPTIARGYASTALLPHDGDGAVILGFVRHDRFQSRLGFDFQGDPMAITIETLIDDKPFVGSVTTEQMVLFAAEAVEDGLRRWAHMVAGAAPEKPRLLDRRITGWCSWYNLYASLDEPVLREHLHAAARFRDEYQVPLDIFQVDDGFTPEMGDWLSFKPQFPNGIAPIMGEAREKGFTPGLWIAPFMVGNRSRLFAEHPDWVVRSRKDGKPLAPMTFYGEFRWHKRSEEYYVLDITHPEAAAYIRRVFRTWAKEWGCGYFKADFMHLGSTYGPDEAVWHQDGLTRIEIWMMMLRLIREEIGEARLLLCGSPIWAPVGYAEGMRIGRDVGVSWSGHYSAQSLLRDQTARGYANGILWQSDPDCILLRSNFHELSDAQVTTLANFAGLAGGVVMTSDNLDEVSPERKGLFAGFLRQTTPNPSGFPQIGKSPISYTLGTNHQNRTAAIPKADPVLVQTFLDHEGTQRTNLINTSDKLVQAAIPGRGDDKLVDLEAFQSLVI